MGKRVPRIGITAYGRENGRFSLPVEYVDSVRRAGGIPLVLVPGQEHPERWLELVDGLIVAGGGDLDPARYSGAAHESIYSVDAERDATELELARALLASDRPGLCICRGMQVLNVALGGTLIEHLPNERDPSRAEVVHVAEPRAPVKHPVSIDSGTFLGSVTGALEIEPFSWHHQAIRKLGRDLEVVAHAADGVIEAVQYTRHPWLLSVQWHPELSAASDPSQQRIFDALVRRAGG